MLVKYEKNNIISYNNRLFADWVWEWLESIKNNIEETTYNGYESSIKVHIDPYFREKKIKLSEISEDHISDYYSFKMDEGNSRRAIGSNTIKHHRVVLKCALDKALIEGHIGHNPVVLVKTPKVNKFRSQYYNLDEVNQLFEVSKGETIEHVIKTTAYYGLRRSEVLGIKWDAIDFSTNTIQIKFVVTDAKKRVEKDRTKNQSSYRTYPLLPQVKDYLLQLKDLEQSNRYYYGDTYNENNFVFKWEDGTPFRPDYISARFKSILEKYGLKRIRFHDLRHSCASILLALKFSLKEIQEWLGHSTIQTTSDIYGHLDFQSKQDIASKMDQVIGTTELPLTETNENEIQNNVINFSTIIGNRTKNKAKV